MTKYLNRETVKALSGVRISEYPLPYDEEMIVRVRSQTMDRMSRYAEAVNAGGERAKKQTYQLIAQSIVDETESPIWDAADVEKLAKTDCRLVTALVKMINQHNGGNDDDAEELLGKLETTQD